MRDDINNLPISKAAKKYARMKSTDLGSDWSQKVDWFISMCAADTNQDTEGFKNRDAAGKVPHAMKGVNEASVAALQRAAQAWCKPSTSHKIMDVELATAFAEILDDVARNLVEMLIYGDGGYRYVTNCINSAVEKIDAMEDQAEEVSKAEFFRNVPLSEIFNSGIAGIYDWTPREWRIAGIGPEKAGQHRGGLRMEKDWAISYYKSVYEGMQCYFFDHSRVAYVFCKLR